MQEVSKEFQDTLKDEIGLDEIRNPKPLEPKKTAAAAGAYTRPLFSST